MKIKRIAHGSKDYRQVLELRRHILRAPLGRDWSEADLEHEAEEWHFGAWEAGRLAGCVAVRWLDGDRVKLRQMAVAADRRGTGVGRRLVEEVLRSVADEGATGVELHSREAAVGFYERLGFAVVGGPFEEVGIRHWKMVKTCGGWAGPLRNPGMEHHVYFWLKKERQNDTDKARYEKGLAKLAESACLAEPGRWGRPAATPERPVTDHSWDYAISFRFATMEDHDRYQGPDPHHQEFVEAFKDWWERVEVKDLEC